ncbi:hypothetical protein MTP99_008531 [Tenebrio molitor]|nr:hypothetical protein MTP99_008531 [Tenebrio molitor]
MTLFCFVDGEVVYACPNCPKEYSRKTSLACHMSLDCGRGVFVCVLCDHSTTRKYNLKHHLCTVHKIFDNFDKHMCKEKRDTCPF